MRVGAPRLESPSDRDRRTIEDFGRQWTRYPDNQGYYGSVDMLADIFGPLLRLEDVAGCRVAEIGSGTGRIVNMLIEAGASHVLAIEPSSAFEVLRRNTEANAGRVEYLRGGGEQIPADGRFDYVFSIGVLHHLEDPGTVVSASHRALRAGGRMLIWLYGREGNELYVSFVSPIRAVTTRLGPWLRAFLCHVVNLLLAPYVVLCRALPLPMSQYCTNVLGKLSWRKRFLVIYDQLSPTVARYYDAREARALLEQAGFERVTLHHRHGYSWTVIGTKAS